MGKAANFESVVRLALVYNRPPPLSAKELFDNKTWKQMTDKSKKHVKKIFNRIYREMGAKN